MWSGDETTHAAPMIAKQCVSSSLLAHTPSDYVSEPCMVPVSRITAAKLFFQAPACLQPTWGFFEDLYLSLRLETSQFLHSPDMTLELVVSLELSSVFFFNSLWCSWS